MKQCTCFALKATNCICAEREDENSFAHWFYGAPHRIKYLRDHPVFLAAQEAWDAAKKQEAEKQEQGEPVAITTGTYGGRFTYVTNKPNVILPNGMALFASPQQRTWVGLTEQEQGAIMEDLNAHGTNLYHFAKAIEAKLKQKNGCAKEKNT